jgi:hypothetical protein
MEIGGSQTSATISLKSLQMDTAKGVLVAHGGKFVTLAPDLKSLNIVETSTGAVKNIHNVQSLISCFAVDGCLICVGDVDSSITIYNISAPSPKDFSVQFYNRTIECCAVSSIFRTAVAATADSFLFLTSLSNKSVQKIVSVMPKNPLSLTITNSWGFVLLHSCATIAGITSHYLSLFTCNGNFLKEQKIENKIIKIEAFADRKGFDFIIFVDKSHVIYYFEAYSIQKILRIGQCKGNAVMISVFVDIESFAIITDASTIKFFHSPSLDSTT